MNFLLFLPVLLFSVVVHEVAHAWVARREGDDTADQLGRITLNPIPHLDLFGSILLPALLHFSGASFLFGWAKPVPVNPGKFRDPVWGDIRVSLAGVASNLILALLCTVLVTVLIKLQTVMGGSVLGTLALAAGFGIQINLILAFFNLLPIPPLDGSHVVYHLLPHGAREQYQQMGRYGLLILVALFVLAPGFISSVILQPVTFLMDAANAFIEIWV
jgi:Zn-dependent protease